MKITKTYLKQIIKEALSEVSDMPIGHEIDYTAKMFPLDFLTLVTPIQEFPFYKKFLNAIKKEKIRDIDGVKRVFDSFNPDIGDNVAHNVVERAIKYFDSSKPHEHVPFLAVEIKGGQGVVGHEGRSRCFGYLLLDALKIKKTDKITVNIKTTADSLKTLESRMQENIEMNIGDHLLGQKLAGHKSGAVPLISITDLQRV